MVQILSRFSTQNYIKRPLKTETSLLFKIFRILDLHFRKLPLLYIEPTPKTEVGPHFKYFFRAQGA